MTIRFRTFGRTSATTTDMASSCPGLIIQYIQLTRHFDIDDLFSLSLSSLHHIHNNRLSFVVLRLEMQHQWVDTRWRYIEDYTQDLTSARSSWPSSDSPCLLLEFASLLAATVSRLLKSELEFLPYCYYDYCIYLGVLETECVGVPLWAPSGKAWRRL